MKQNKEKQKIILNKNTGITLIALVITIIVLLILAGVSIAMLTGENGVLTKASQASLENDFASVKEGINLAVSEYHMLKIGVGNAPDFKTWLSQKGYIDENNTINTGNLLNTTLSTGKGKTTSTKDVYKLEEEVETAKVASTVKVAATTTEDKTYKIEYYNEDGESREITRFSLTETAELEETDPDLFEVSEDGKITLKDYNDYYSNRKEWNIENVVIPSQIDGKNVTKISGFDFFSGWGRSYNEQFYFLDKIKSIIIPEGVTEILDGSYNGGIGAFAYLNNLQTISLPSTLNHIGNSAFSECRALYEIEIPETVTNMGDAVFYGWTPEQTIKVPFKEGEPVPDGWDESWDFGCQAKIEYAQ